MLVNNRVAWIDWVRILACLMVVVGHCCDPFMAKMGVVESDYLAAVFMGSLLRSSVPLFTMMTAMLLLPVGESLSTFYRRRIGRVGRIMLFWFLVTPFVFHLYYTYANPQTIHPNIVVGDYTLEHTLRKLYTFLFNFSYETLVFWYLYMLVGIYFLLPILSPWLEKATRKEYHVLLSIWGVSTCLPLIQYFAPSLGYIGNGGNMGLLGVCDWNPYGMFYYVSGFVGYVVLAYYFKRFPLTISLKKSLVVGFSLFAVGYCSTVIGFLEMNKLYFGDYSKLEIIWFFCGINVVLMTLGLFLIAMRLPWKGSPVVSRIASLMLGVYLVHFLVVHIAYEQLYEVLGCSSIMKILIMGFASFGVTLLIVWLMSFSKWLRKVIM